MIGSESLKPIYLILVKAILPTNHNLVLHIFNQSSTCTGPEGLMCFLRIIPDLVISIQTKVLRHSTSNHYKMKHYLSLTVMIICIHLHNCNAVSTNLESINSNERELSSRIIGGKRANATRYPYYTFLKIFVQSGEIYNCGGSLVNSDVVLTAAHCFVDESDPAVSIKVYVNYTERIVNTWNLTKYVYERDAKVWIPHKKYNETTFQNDIALIILDKPVLEVSPVKINNAAIVPPDGKLVTAIGHGYVSQGDNAEFPKVLMEVNISVIPFHDCQEAWVNDGISVVKKIMICAGVSIGIKSACFGDSGGPLLIVGNNGTDDDVQVGLTSFGFEDCSSKIFPNVFTRVSYYKKWIDDVTCQRSNMKPTSCKTSKPTRKPTKPLVTSRPSQKPKLLQTLVPTRKHDSIMP
jgi:trypsin